MKEIVVIGCGIIGLSTAVRLQEKGYRVRIIARDLPPCTTSNRAAAIWTPYKAEPQDKVDKWSAESYAQYAAEYEIAEAGVSKVELLTISRVGQERPFWLRPEYPSRILGPDELPDGYREGYAVTVPFVHSGLYLDFLLHRFAELGGDLELRNLRSPAELGSEFEAIVNCSGLGARELVNDRSMYAIRGQLAIVKPRQALQRRFFVDDTSYDGPVYIFPRGKEWVLGGSAEKGNEQIREDRLLRSNIIDRCRQIEPALASASFIRPVVGLRPGRAEIRLEWESANRGPLMIHNYGHGGSGFTVAWGCASEVLKLLTAG